jgi:hypothetical protein
VTFSPDGTRLATGGDDGTIRIWEAATGRALATLVALSEDGWATLLPDGSYKLKGEPSGRFWWVIGLRRFELGELDGFSPNVRRRAVDEPISGLAQAHHRPPAPAVEHVEDAAQTSPLADRDHASGRGRRWWRRRGI